MAIAITTPIISAKQFAENNDISEKAVNSQMDEGVLPTYQIKKGGKRYINLVALTMRCEEQATSKPWN